MLSKESYDLIYGKGIFLSRARSDPDNPDDADPFGSGKRTYSETERQMSSRFQSFVHLHEVLGPAFMEVLGKNPREYGLGDGNYDRDRIQKIIAKAESSTHPFAIHIEPLFERLFEEVMAINSLYPRPSKVIPSIEEPDDDPPWITEPGVPYKSGDIVEHEGFRWVARKPLAGTPPSETDSRWSLLSAYYPDGYKQPQLEVTR